MNKRSLLSISTIAVPLVALFVAGAVLAFEVHRLHSLEQQTALADAQLTQIEKLTKEFGDQPAVGKIPAVPNYPAEQVDYLNTMRAYADASKVRLTKWSSSGAFVNTKDLPAGISSVSAAVEIGGSYGHVRQFLYYLLRSRRLINMTDLKWSRGQWPTTHLSFNLTRYVSSTPPAPGIAPPAATPPANGGAGTSTPTSTATKQGAIGSGSA